MCTFFTVSALQRHINGQVLTTQPCVRRSADNEQVELSNCQTIGNLSETGKQNSSKVQNGLQIAARFALCKGEEYIFTSEKENAVEGREMAQNADDCKRPEQDETARGRTPGGTRGASPLSSAEIPPEELQIRERLL